MQMLYNSDSFTVVAFDLPGVPVAGGAMARLYIGAGKQASIRP